MKLTKQTVYLPVNDVKDSNYFIQNWGHVTEDYAIKKEGYFFTPEQLNQLLSDVIKDALNTAAEKGKVLHKGYGEMVVNKSSITNTFEETFNKFKT